MRLLQSGLLLLLLHSVISQPSPPADRNTGSANDLWLGDILSGVLGKLDKTNVNVSSDLSTPSVPAERAPSVPQSSPSTTINTASTNISFSTEPLPTTAPSKLGDKFLSRILYNIFDILKRQETTTTPLKVTTSAYQDKSSPAYAVSKVDTLGLLKGLAQSSTSTALPAQTTEGPVLTTVVIHHGRSPPPSPENAVALVDGSRSENFGVSKVIADFASTIASQIKNFTRTGEYPVYQTPSEKKHSTGVLKTDQPPRTPEYTDYTTTTKTSLLPADRKLSPFLLNLIARGLIPQKPSETTLGSTPSSTTIPFTETETKSVAVDVVNQERKSQTTPTAEKATTIKSVTPTQTTSTLKSDFTKFTKTIIGTPATITSKTTTTPTISPSATRDRQDTAVQLITTTTTATLATTTEAVVPQTTKIRATLDERGLSFGTTPTAFNMSSSTTEAVSTVAWEVFTVPTRDTPARLPQLRRPVPVKKHNGTKPKVIRTDATHLEEKVTQSSIQGSSGARSSKGLWTERLAVYMQTVVLLLVMNGFLV